MSSAWDPLGTRETLGYLENAAGSNDPLTIRRLEHASVTFGLPTAVAQLGQRENLRYVDVLTTHQILFEAAYPTWAGQDRLALTPSQSVARGSIQFANAAEIRTIAGQALDQGGQPGVLRRHPGRVLGEMARAHPFLEGNGRTIMTLHAVLTHRAGFSIDWSQCNTRDYLVALGDHIADPGADVLDQFLAPLVRPPIPLESIASAVLNMRGLGNAHLEPDRWRAMTPDERIADPAFGLAQGVLNDCLAAWSKEGFNSRVIEAELRIREDVMLAILSEGDPLASNLLERLTADRKPPDPGTYPSGRRGRSSRR